MATERGPLPAPKFAAAPNDPAPLPSSTETLLELKFATARSGSPSRSRSPMATEAGRLPAPKFVAAPNDPAPFPSSTETLSENRFAVARSGSPSRFRSPMARERGPSPAPKFVAAPKVTAAADAGSRGITTPMVMNAMNARAVNGRRRLVIGAPLVAGTHGRGGAPGVPRLPAGTVGDRHKAVKGPKRDELWADLAGRATGGPAARADVDP